MSCLARKSFEFRPSSRSDPLPDEFKSETMRCNSERVSADDVRSMVRAAALLGQDPATRPLPHPDRNPDQVGSPVAGDHWESPPWSTPAEIEQCRAAVSGWHEGNYAKLDNVNDASLLR